MFLRGSNSDDSQQLEGRSICAQDYEHGNWECIRGFSMNHHEWSQSPLHSGYVGRPRRLEPRLHTWQIKRFDPETLRFLEYIGALSVIFWILSSLF